jgi:hypothetical protein
VRQFGVVPVYDAAPVAFSFVAYHCLVLVFVMSIVGQFTHPLTR